MKSILSLIVLSLLSGAALGQAPKGATKPAQGAGSKPTAQPQAQKPEVKEDCGCESKAPPDVVATINGVRLTIKDIDDSLKPKIDELQQQVIEARKKELDLQINSRLLEAEGAKRGVPASKLIDAEVIDKTVEPTEADAQAFYDQNKARITGDFASIKKDIVDYLRNQRQREQAAKFAERLRATSDVKVLVKDVTPATTPAERARVLATVNGKPITSGDVEDSLKPLIYEVQEQIYNLRKNQIELKVNDTLLEQEAAKKKVTTRSLLEAEVTPKIKAVSDEDAKKFYDENKERINGEYGPIKDQIKEYLKQQEERKALGEYATALRKASAVTVSLPEPELPSYKIDTEGQPWKGAENAEVTIIEFTDFQCPMCAKTHPILDELVREYNGKVRLVVRDYPLPQHENALKAAEAAEAAREQGKYWEFVSLMFENQKELGVVKLKEYATRLGLDRKRFDESLDSGKFAAQVQKDLQEGLKIGVNSTPSVYVNGVMVKDRTKEGLKAAIETALKPRADSRASK
ncbi:MAG TPA: thioredoxin domain-containing protein [Blastocatellia bacterium]|jgi:protein-disulfide isomerase|nr:thioredoxin domain-containing protein [Blastocatellia bacterium]